MSKIPLIVYLDDAPILGKSLLDERPPGPYCFHSTYLLPRDFTGVTIRLESGDVSYFCGAFAVGAFVPSLYRLSTLTADQRKSIYHRTIDALRRYLSEENGSYEGYKISNCIVIGDRERDIVDYRLSLWEMGHMLPCLRTDKYVNKNSSNFVRMFVFNP